MPRAPSSTSAYGAAGPARSTPPRPRFASIFCPDWAASSENPAIQQPPQSRQTRRAQATRYLPETSPGPRGGASSQAGLDSRNCSRCQGVVMFSASSPTTPNISRSPSGYPPDVASMFRAGSELDPPCRDDLFLHGRYLRCYYQTILFLFSLLEPPIFYCVDTPLLFDQGAVSTKHDIGSDRARLLRLPRSHISPISSPHLAVLTIRLWRETSCAGGESTRHRLPQRSLWTGDGKTDKVSAGRTPSQTD